MSKVVLLALIVFGFFFLLRRVIMACWFRSWLNKLCHREDEFYREMVSQGRLYAREQTDECYPLKWLKVHRHHFTVWRMIWNRKGFCLYQRVPNENVRDRLIGFCLYEQKSHKR